MDGKLFSNNFPNDDVNDDDKAAELRGKQPKVAVKVLRTVKEAMLRLKYCARLKRLGRNLDTKLFNVEPLVAGRKGKATMEVEQSSCETLSRLLYLKVLN